MISECEEPMIERFPIVIPIVPFGTKVVIRPDPKDAKPKMHGSIMLPETMASSETLACATVIRVPDVAHEKVWAKVGMRVWYQKHAGHAIKVGDADYRVIEQDNLIAAQESNPDSETSD